ncbi:hypothetical protein CVT24_004687 [Panaeolus cyanescens]|uniref:Uncharacterized protein n=1 Tax=Panaeolus cyanescens TaxID=181874 RepID=A0A409WYH8_9AGAR|nr:hypothetical protein CVT24_004687 [Panaeolus cyanescens]
MRLHPLFHFRLRLPFTPHIHHPAPQSQRQPHPPLLISTTSAASAAEYPSAPDPYMPTKPSHSLHPLFHMTGTATPGILHTATQLLCTPHHILPPFLVFSPPLCSSHPTPTLNISPSNLYGSTITLCSSTHTLSPATPAPPSPPPPSIPSPSPSSTPFPSPSSTPSPSLPTTPSPYALTLLQHLHSPPSPHNILATSLSRIYAMARPSPCAHAP